MNLAILITGELRIPDLENLLNSINNYDIFISTYDEYLDIALKITSKNNILTYDRNKLHLSTKTLYQWFHLKNLLKYFKSRLINFDILLKIRSDCYFFEPITENNFINFKKNFFYMNSDHSFYADTNHFYKILKKYWLIINKKYLNNIDKPFKINYINLIYSYNKIYRSNYVNQYLNNYNNDSNNLPRLNIRANFNIGMREQLYPRLIYHKDNLILYKNMKLHKKYLMNNHDDIEDFYCKNKPKNNIFPSEKIFFLHVINKSKILPFELPTIGVFKKYY